MARKTRVFTVNDEKSRDNGRSYLITEMPADAAEWWAIRALQAILTTDAEIEFDTPFAQLARQGLAAFAKIEPEKSRPLLDEMFQCVRVKLPGSNDSREMLGNDIEEVKTRVLLRREIFALYFDFFESGGE